MIDKVEWDAFEQNIAEHRETLLRILRPVRHVDPDDKKTPRELDEDTWRKIGYLAGDYKQEQIRARAQAVEAKLNRLYARLQKNVKNSLDTIKLCMDEHNEIRSQFQIDLDDDLSFQLRGGDGDFEPPLFMSNGLSEFEWLLKALNSLEYSAGQLIKPAQRDTHPFDRGMLSREFVHEMATLFQGVTLKEVDLDGPFIDFACAFLVMLDLKTIERPGIRKALREGRKWSLEWHTESPFRPDPKVTGEEQ
jgi:hypothetical protein